MSEDYLPVVTGVAVVGDRVLRLLFSDGTVGDVDFSAERWTGVLAPLNDPAYELVHDRALGNADADPLSNAGSLTSVDASTALWLAYRAPRRYFAEVAIDHEAGTLAWPDGIDLAPEPLYEQAKAHPLVAA